MLTIGLMVNSLYRWRCVTPCCLLAKQFSGARPAANCELYVLGYGYSRDVLQRNPQSHLNILTASPVCDSEQRI